MAGETVYIPGRREANPPRERAPAPKSRFLKFTFGSAGTVSCGFEGPRPALKSSIDIPAGSPSRARGIEISLKSRSPNWKEAWVPLTEGSKSPVPSQREEVAFHR